MSAPKLVLPTEVTAPSKHWINQRFLMPGQAGIGKSTFWSNDPNALFLDTEGNLTHLAVKKVAIRCWEDLQEVAALLYAEKAKNQLFPYSTLVIDTGDRMLSCCEEYVIGLAKEKFKAVADRINVLGDVPEGVGWANTTKLMMNALTKLDELPCALAIITHVKQTKVEEPTQKYDKETISLWGNVGVNLMGFVKHTMHLQAYYVGDALKRVVRTLPSKGIEAKSHGGLVPDRIEWKSADLKAEWLAFRALFDGEPGGTQG